MKEHRPRSAPRPASGTTPETGAESPSLLTLATHGRMPRFADPELAAAVFGLVTRHPATIASCLLPDRLEWLILEGWDVEETVGRFKAVSRRVAREQGAPGPLWQRRHERRAIASGHGLQLAGRHVADAPVRAGLVKRSSDYPFRSWLRDARPRRVQSPARGPDTS